MIGHLSRVTLVSGSACHLCEDARAALDECAAEFGIDVRIVDAASSEGWALLARYRPALLPLILLDGEVFSTGRLPRKKLRHRLQSRTVPA